MPHILFICPTYGKFEYAKRAVETFFQHSGEDDHCLVVDDASPDWYGAGLACLDPVDAATDKPRMCRHRFIEHGGVIRSWNYGLTFAKDHSYEYVVCTNSDVLFTPFWYRGLICMLDEKDRGLGEHMRYRLAGPVTNCPGAPQYGKQNIKRYYPNYTVHDDPVVLAAIAEHLRESHWAEAVEAHINGFFLMARTETWWEGAFDAEHVFNPYNEFNSKGQRCPDPLNSLCEDELQRRWREKGWRIGFTPASFVFHYRAVTRGGRAAEVEGAYRLSPPAA